MVNPLRFELGADLLAGDPCLRRGDDQFQVYLQASKKTLTLV